MVWVSQGIPDLGRLPLEVSDVRQAHRHTVMTPAGTELGDLQSDEQIKKTPLLITKIFSAKARPKA